MIRVNLLPIREAQRKERVRSQISILILSLIFTVLVCGALFTTMKVQINSQKTKNSQIQAQINKLKKDIGKVNEYKKLKAELEEKLKVLAQLKRQRSGPVKMMDELVMALPEKLWLETAVQKGSSLQVKGVAVSERAVAEFMRNLERQDTFTSVDLRQTKMKQGEGLKLQEFTLNVMAAAATPPPAQTPAK